VPSTRETVVVLVMNGLHLSRESPQEGVEKQDPLLQNCINILRLMGRVGVHVADMAYVHFSISIRYTVSESTIPTPNLCGLLVFRNMLCELAAPIKASPSL
jgi:hypothetical protein